MTQNLTIYFPIILRMEHLSKIAMKKKILITDIIFIVITISLLLYFNYTESTGLAALEDAGKFVVCLLCLGVEALILITLCVICLCKKAKDSI